MLQGSLKAQLKNEYLQKQRLKRKKENLEKLFELLILYFVVNKFDLSDRFQSFKWRASFFSVQHCVTYGSVFVVEAWD